MDSDPQDKVNIVEQRPARPRCFLDLKISNPSTQISDSDTNIHRIIVELYADICPLTCENFRCLCTGEKGVSPTTNKPLHYKDTPVHRVVKNFMVQGGDIIMGNGKSGESIYGKLFPDENFEIKHDKPYMLSMANKGKDTNSSQFFITTVPAPHLDGLHVAFGHVVSGQNAVRLVEEIPTDETYKPAFPVTIVKSGELVLQIKKRLPTAPSLEAGKQGAGSGSGLSSTSSVDDSDSEGEIHDKEQVGDEVVAGGRPEANAAATLPPDIPRNYLLRRCDVPQQTLANGQTPAAPGSLVAGLTSADGDDDDLPAKIPPWLLPSGDGSTAADADMVQLKALMSQHLPNPEALSSTFDPSAPTKGDRDRGRDHNSSRSRSRNRSFDRTRAHGRDDGGRDRRTSDGRNGRRDPRRNDHDPVYRHLDTYYEERRRRNYQPGEGEASQGREGRVKKGKGIPPHLLRKLRRSSTPPHWKDAQRRLVKLKEVLKPGKVADVTLSPEFVELKKDQENNFLMSLKLEREEAENKGKNKPIKPLQHDKGRQFWTSYKANRYNEPKVGRFFTNELTQLPPNPKAQAQNIPKSTIKVVTNNSAVDKAPALPEEPSQKSARNGSRDGRGTKRPVSRDHHDRHRHHHHHDHVTSGKRHHGSHHHHNHSSRKTDRDQDHKSRRTKYREEKGRRASSLASSSDGSSSATSVTARDDKKLNHSRHAAAHDKGKDVGKGQVIKEHNDDNKSHNNKQKIFHEVAAPVK